MKKEKYTQPNPFDIFIFTHVRGQIHAVLTHQVKKQKAA